MSKDCCEKCKEFDHYALPTGNCLNPDCPCHSPSNKDIRHEELFSHRNKLCKCFAPREGKKDGWVAGFYALAKEYARMSYLVSEENWPPHKETDALNNLQNLITHLLTTEREKERRRFSALIDEAVNEISYSLNRPERIMQFLKDSLLTNQ